MFDITVKQEQIQYVESLLTHVNFGQRGDADGNYTQQRTGIISQVVLSDLLGYERPKGDGFDGGIDFVLNGFRLDLKTMGRTVPVQEHYVHNFMGSQIHFNVDAYIFASYNTKKNVITICGWLFKEDFEVLSCFYQQGELRYRDDGTAFSVRGKAGMYEISQSVLNPFASEQDFLSLCWLSK